MTHGEQRNGISSTRSPSCLKRLLLTSGFVEHVPHTGEHTMKSFALVFVSVCWICSNVPADVVAAKRRSHVSSLDAERDTGFWVRKGEEELRRQIDRKLNLNLAKNVIFFLGDGMSIPTMTAARAYKAQLEGKMGGEGEFLSFEKFPYSGLSRTYCLDSKVADSACSATAFFRGVKCNIGLIGVNGRVTKGDCEAARNESNRVDGIATWAQNAGRSTGFVTMTSVTDATPAGTFAYTANRDWECDADVRKDGKDPKVCEDVAKQLVLRNPGKNFNVIMGGGRRFFIPKTEIDEEQKPGNREDGTNLIQTWIKDKVDRKEDYAYVSNRTALLSLTKPPNYLMGIFGRGNLDYNVHQNKLQPTLSEMTKTAIEVLRKNPKGYFLLVEGGIIDTAHHESRAQISLDETVEFEKAIQLAVNMTDEEDTLIVVTADHAHVMSINGYPKRLTNIFGFSGQAKDKFPYTILSYANGPGYNFESGRRHDMTQDKTNAPNYVFPSGVPLSSETHGGDDVAVFARGPHSHIFTGSYEESYLAVAMGYASGLRGKSTQHSHTENGN